MRTLSRMNASATFLMMLLTSCKSGSGPHAVATSASTHGTAGPSPAAKPVSVPLPIAPPAAAPVLAAGNPADIWNTPSATVNPKALPLGDQKYVTDAPRVGYVFACDPKMFQFQNIVGATVTGSWVHQNTFDITAKISVQGAVSHAGQFAITTNGSDRIFNANGLPSGVTTGVFPTLPSDPAYQYDQNPDSLIAQTIAFSVPLNPVLQTAPTCTGLEVGITLDGVELSGPLDSSGRDEMAYEMMDSCTGMAQPGGLYHRHALSSCIPHIHENNALVGYALDGFGIFSPYDANGKELTTSDLDECHGTTSEILWNGNLVNMYHYVLTRDFPYSVSCFRGRPVAKNFPALPPPPQPQGEGTAIKGWSHVDVSCSFYTPDSASQALTHVAAESASQCATDVANLNKLYGQLSGLTCQQSQQIISGLPKGPAGSPPPLVPVPGGAIYSAMEACSQKSAAENAACPVGFTEYDGLFGLPCGGTTSCWAQKSSGATGGVDGAPYGWPTWVAQCTKQSAAKVTNSCPAKFAAYDGLFGTACTGTQTCWSPASSGASGGVDASPYGWAGWDVQCKAESPSQLVTDCPAGFAAYDGNFGTPCASAKTCWAQKSSGAAGGLDAAAYGWAAWKYQCFGQPQSP